MTESKWSPGQIVDAVIYPYRENQSVFEVVLEERHEVDGIGYWRAKFVDRLGYLTVCEELLMIQEVPNA